MPDRPSPFVEDSKPTKDAEAAQSRLSAESQKTEIKSLTVSPEALFSGAYSPTLRIPPFAKLEQLNGTEQPAEKPTKPNPDLPTRPLPFDHNPYDFDRMWAEATRKVNERPFTTANPVLLASGLGQYAIGMSSPGLLGQVNRGLGGGVLMGLGGFQGYKDYSNLLNADSNIGTMKYSAALTADAGIVSGGILSLAKCGPKWLAPTVLLGSLAGRMALDLVPNR